MNYLGLIIIAIILIALLVFSYKQCYLNNLLPDDYKKKCDPVDEFVGAMAQNSALVPCAFANSDDWQTNRCTYV